jgi:hypothetical protein
VNSQSGTTRHQATACRREHTWKRILFDTNIVARWMDGDSDFQALVQRLAKRRPTFDVSAVSAGAGSHLTRFEAAAPSD